MTDVETLQKHDSVHTIQDALARISHQQTVQLGLSEAFPSILVLHLKRFLYDKATNGIVKICKSVQLAPVLEIPPEIMSSVAGKFAEPVHYKLYGVLYHHGESAGTGHYTVDVLHPNGDNGDREAWLHIDDETPVIRLVPALASPGAGVVFREEPERRSRPVTFTRLPRSGRLVKIWTYIKLSLIVRFGRSGPVA
ncbi:hypothetical protein DFH94DRAFT_811842 [Russula ochroleuca]|uniref:ubiquitinyl hydrolase 1 n=1 Tax=Russula ochroleuca TaxID=152965 RepID=A0A9P5JXG9_9AGAM|nr:hypothetical protein DFH94DRAFT_817628 [Russula ochroleuca]KAF8470281.1 hypothetical protein DFH94DRAFT_811842 [Russula ochroleuca]